MFAFNLLVDKIKQILLKTSEIICTYTITRVSKFISKAQVIQYNNMSTNEKRFIRKVRERKERVERQTFEHMYITFN